MHKKPVDFSCNKPCGLFLLQQDIQDIVTGQASGTTKYGFCSSIMQVGPEDKFGRSFR